jgi:hypothetical protein
MVILSCGLGWRRFFPGVVEAEVGFGQFQVEQILATGEHQGTGFGQASFVLFEQIGDVLAAEGMKFEGVLDGADGFLDAVDFTQGDDFADVVERVEAVFLKLAVEGFGLWGER